MNSRQIILERVKSAKPQSVPLESLDSLLDIDPLELEEDHVPHFKATLELLSTKVIELENEDLIDNHLQQLFNYKNNVVINALNQSLYYESLDRLYLFIARGVLGVAENGAIWVEKKDLPGKAPVLPFVCEHLVLVIDRGAIVPNMHGAYKLLSKSGFSYGVFISGPSKTADIEQSLVIGAHGPKSLTVFIVQQKLRDE